MSSDSCAWNDTLCEELGVGNMLIDHLSQRDIAYSVGIDQAFLAGISVNDMGNDWQRWLRTSLAVGFRAVYMDLAWYNGQWSLCPESSNTTCATIGNVTSVINDFIAQTDTNVAVDLLRLGLRFRMGPNGADDIAEIRQYNLTNEIQFVLPRLLTPQTVLSDQMGLSVSSVGVNRQIINTLWPSLETTLLDSKARFFITADTSRLPHNISLNILNNLAFNDSSHISGLAPVSWPLTEIPQQLEGDYSKLGNLPFRSVSINHGPEILSDWINAIDSGYSPVLNGSVNNDILKALATYCEWPWAPNQPSYESSQTRQELLENQNYSMCAAQTVDGWIVENCHRDGHILCLNQTDSFGWILKNELNPFSATSTTDACPEGFTFSAPRSHLQAAAAKAALTKANVSWAWTPINSLSLENCWVNGINTYCPYNIVTGNRNGVGLLSVVAAIGFGIVVGMVLLEYRHSKMPLRPRARAKKAKSKPQRK